MFISEPVNGLYYIAERSPKGYRKYLWSIMSVAASAGINGPVDVDDVPRGIRKAAHKMFRDDRVWQQRQDFNPLKEWRR